jgi:hypothetical protein
MDSNTSSPIFTGPNGGIPEEKYNIVKQQLREMTEVGRMGTI